MKRQRGAFGFRAVIVESVGAMVLLFMLLPSAARPIRSKQISSGPATPTVSSSETATSDTTESLPSLTGSTAQVSSRWLPILSLPASPVAARSTASTSAQPVDANATQERRAFVTRELEYSRRALVMMLNQHVQRLIEPFRENE